MTTAHYMRQRRYGMTEVEFNQRSDQQGFLCKICRTPYPSQGKHQTLRVDHDPRKGKVRGLLCDSCNLGLGKFRHSITKLQQAVQYLLDSQ